MKKKFIWWILIILLAWFGYTYRDNIKEIPRVLSQGRWQFVLLAAVIQVLYYTTFAALYQSVFSMLGIKRKIKEILPIIPSSIFINSVAPTAGLGAVALFMDDAHRRNEPTARMTVGFIVTQIFDYLTYAVILAFSLFYLSLSNNLKTYEIVGALILFAIILALVLLIALALWRPKFLKTVLLGGETWINRLSKIFRRAPILANNWASEHTAEFIEAVETLRNNPNGVVRSLGFGFLLHFVDIASIYALFLAFHQSVSLGTLVAGFSIAILFWIVSVTPQGIGVVEGAMAVLYASLGVPAAIATIIAIAFRGLTFWAPLLIGVFTLRRLDSLTAERKTQEEAWSVKLVAVFVAAIGVIDILSAITPALQSRLLRIDELFPVSAQHGTRLFAALAGFALLGLAANLWRRKRVAWFLSLLFLIFSAISHLVKGFDYEEAILALLVAGWLWVKRYEFHAHSDRPSIWQGIKVLLISVIFTIIYGTSGFYLLDRQYSINFDFSAAFLQTIKIFSQFYNTGLHPATAYGRYFVDSIYGIGIASLAYSLLMILRPVVVRNPASFSERKRAEKIAKEFGCTSLVSFSCLPDKNLYFTRGGSYVSYVVKGRIALALGDPIGPRDDMATAISEFTDWCKINDWSAAFYQVGDQTVREYEQLEYKKLPIGNEAIINLGDLSLEGSENKPLRNSINRVERLDHSIEVLTPPLSEAVLDQLEEISDEWLAMMHGNEKRFSLGWFDRDLVRNATVITVRLPDGTRSAFATIIPEECERQVAVDLMRKRRTAEVGTMDFLIYKTMEKARDWGYATFSLGMSPLSGIGGKSNDPFAEKTIRFIYENVNLFYNFKGLHKFKDKFHPSWSTRYLIYPSSAVLPSILIALFRAQSGDDFILQQIAPLVRIQRTFQR